jgi:hypothetical protein
MGSNHSASDIATNIRIDPLKLHTGASVRESIVEEANKVKPVEKLMAEPSPIVTSPNQRCRDVLSTRRLIFHKLYTFDCKSIEVLEECDISRSEMLMDHRLIVCQPPQEVLQQQTREFRREREAEEMAALIRAARDFVDDVFGDRTTQSAYTSPSNTTDSDPMNTHLFGWSNLPTSNASL